MSINANALRLDIRFVYKLKIYINLTKQYEKSQITCMYMSLLLHASKSCLYNGKFDRFTDHEIDMCG